LCDKIIVYQFKNMADKIEESYCSVQSILKDDRNISYIFTKDQMENIKFIPLNFSKDQQLKKVFYQKLLLLKFSKYFINLCLFLSIYYEYIVFP